MAVTLFIIVRWSTWSICYNDTFLLKVYTINTKNLLKKLLTE